MSSSIIGLDKEPMPNSLKPISRSSRISRRIRQTAGTGSQRSRSSHPDIVIHTVTWQIREIYGDHALTWKWNIDGSSDNVFDFAFAHELREAPHPFLDGRSNT